MFRKRLEDVPSYPSYGNKGQELGKILYNEASIHLHFFLFY
jgi:beta-glucosidase